MLPALSGQRSVDPDRGLLLPVGEATVDGKPVKTTSVESAQTLVNRQGGNTQRTSGEARIVDLKSDAALAPIARTNGVGMPGYRAGWFRLRSGEKALVFVTDSQRAVYLPTTEGYALIASPADPDAFLAALR